MTSDSRLLRSAGLALAFVVVSTHASIALAQGQQPPGRGAVDPRVQQRTYLFTDTGEQMPYALFVSSKVTRDRKNPLIVSLHGLGGDQNTMVRESLRSVELAEQGGYILVAPMGYNSGGWYGIPPGAPRGGGANAAGRGARGGGRGVTAGGTAIKDGGVPMLVSMGDADEAVPVANVRTWVETMKELGMNHEYKEYPGVTHGPIMAASMADIYAYFARHSKPAAR